MNQSCIADPDAPERFIRERGLNGAISDLHQVASCIARVTKLGPNESWDDPEEWQMEAVMLAHGFVALANEFQRRKLFGLE